MWSRAKTALAWVSKLGSNNTWVLAVAVVGLVFTAFETSRTVAAQTVLMANDVRTCLVDSARRFQEARNEVARNEAAARFELANMLHAMNTYLKQADELGLEIHDRSFLVDTLVALAQQEYCLKDRPNRELAAELLIADLPMLAPKQFGPLRKLAKDRKACGTGVAELTDDGELTRESHTLEQS